MDEAHGVTLPGSGAYSPRCINGFNCWVAGRSRPESFTSILQVMSIPIVHEWNTPVTHLPRRKVGKAAITYETYDPGVYESYRLNGHSYYELADSIRVTALKIDGKVWMVDDPPHVWAMTQHASFMHGHVLCGGLGLGLMAHALVKNPRVKRITIVEIEPDVIKLMRPTLPKGCRVICGDFWKQDIEADSVLLDILVGNGHQLLPIATQQYLALRQRYLKAPIRIHGFNCDGLEKLSQIISTAHAEFARLHL